MIEQHLIPIDDSGPHVQRPECPCRPKMKLIRDGVAYFHPSWDHREFWIAIETMLGMRCKKHHRYIGPDGEHHRVEPLFEYDHQKIDPNNI